MLRCWTKARTRKLIEIWMTQTKKNRQQRKNKWISSPMPANKQLQNQNTPFKNRFHLRNVGRKAEKCQRSILSGNHQIYSRCRKIYCKSWIMQKFKILTQVIKTYLISYLTHPNSSRIKLQNTLAAMKTCKWFLKKSLL